MKSLDYTTKSKNYFQTKRLEMVPFIPTTAVRILEIGCGGGDFSAHLKSLRDIHITGIESYDKAAIAAKSKVDRLIVDSAESALASLPSESFDCVIMNDVIEHLADPWAILGSVKRILVMNGSFVASIPNIRYFPVLREYFMEGQWRYRDDGVMDRTHLRFFTKRSIVDLLSDAGFRIECVQGINELNILPWKFRLLKTISKGMFDDVVFKQFACVARPT